MRADNGYVLIVATMKEDALFVVMVAVDMLKWLMVAVVELIKLKADGGVITFSWM